MVQQSDFSLSHGNFFFIHGKKDPLNKDPFWEEEGVKQKSLPGQIQGLAIVMPDIQEMDANWIPCTQQREVCAVGDTQLTASVGVTTGFSYEEHHSLRFSVGLF